MGGIRARNSVGVSILLENVRVTVMIILGDGILYHGMGPLSGFFFRSFLCYLFGLDLHSSHDTPYLLFLLLLKNPGVCVLICCVALLGGRSGYPGYMGWLLLLVSCLAGVIFFSFSTMGWVAVAVAVVNS